MFRQLINGPDNEYAMIGSTLCVPTCTVLGPKGDANAQAIGRSKGGLSTKTHATCDALGNPTGFHLTPGNACDLDDADVLLADPSKKNRKQPRDYDQDLYKERHLIESFFAKLKQYRGIATRYDKLAENFLGGIYLAATLI